MRRVVCADDFGLSADVNEAICLLHDRGIVGRTSLLVNTPLFGASVEALRERPDLDVAVHLNLTDGRPVLTASRVPTLVGPDGAFRGGRHYAVAARMAAGWMSVAEIRDEWRAQIAKAVDAGLRVGQLNAHGHLHLVPRLHGAVADLLEVFAIKGLRVVLSGRSLRGWLLRRWSLGLMREVRARGLEVEVPDRILGLGDQGSLTARRLAALLAEEGDGVAELIVHPALAPNDFHRRWGYHGERETAALLSAGPARRS
jgi:predicted glycoside hydrolase/deacetylase ChbG (UPF0249 family)